MSLYIYAHIQHRSPITMLSRHPQPALRARVRRGNRDDAAQMRKDLLEAAMALFAEGGVEAVSVRSIAARVGVSPMTPYRYFPSKADFLRGLWVDVLTDLDAYLRDAVREEADPRARHRRLVDAFLAYWEGHPAEFELVFRTQGLSPGPQADRDAHPPEYQRLLATSRATTAELAQAIGAGPERVVLASDLRVAMQFGYLQAAMVNQRYPWSDLPALRRLYVDAVVQAVERCLLGDTPAYSNG
jgi:AcrR family transcriptional regulator